MTDPAPVLPWQQGLYQQLLELRDRLPNGIIVAGPRGIGTFELVHRFALDLLCETPLESGEACGRCPGCRLARAGSHPDIQYVLSEAEALPRGLPFEPPSGASTGRKKLYEDILIHQPRALADFVNLHGGRDGARVVLVYPADRIREDAASVFLKMLEEPPQGLVFLLVAEDLEKVLPTIRSRCRILKALPPPRQEALEWLRSKGVKEPEAALAEAGGMPLAVFETSEARLLAPEARETLLKLLRSPSAPGWGAQVASLVGRDWALEPVSLLLERWAWDLAAVRAGLPARYFPGEAAALAQLAPSIVREPFFKWQDELIALRAVAGHPLNARLTVEQILLAYGSAFVRSSRL